MGAQIFLFAMDRQPPSRPPPLPQQTLQTMSLVLAVQILYHATEEDLQEALGWLEQARPHNGELFMNLIQTITWWRQRVRRAREAQRPAAQQG